MEFTEIISIAGYAIEAIGILVVVVGSILSSVTFICSYQQLPEGVAYRIFRIAAVMPCQIFSHHAINVRS